MLNFLRKWGLSLLMMAAIFGFSSVPGKVMPNFGEADIFVKKGGHMLGYALLALAYSYGNGWNKKRPWLPWLLAILFAATDEFHQSFVQGRHPTPVDVGIDTIGAGLGLLVKYFALNPITSRLRPG